MRTPALLPRALLTCCWLLAPVNSIHPECRFHLEIQEEETKCAELLRAESEKYKDLERMWPVLGRCRRGTCVFLVVPRSKSCCYAVWLKWL
uniref:Vasoactive intestinal peptide receptor 2 n=1 Tax=Equus asinus TaxID=9793 RepID=A0A9L0K6S8_EQUAS